MTFNTTTMLALLAILAVVYVSYTMQKLKTRIHCTFIRADKTKIEKWVKATQRRIAFDGGWYYVVPKRIILAVWDKGIFSLFPTKVQSLIFKWDDPNPLDPETFNNTWETPETRANLNKEEDIRAYAHGNMTATGKQKKGMLEGLMPILTIAGFVIVGYVLYIIMKKQDMLGNAINVLQEMLMR